MAASEFAQAYDLPIWSVSRHISYFDLETKRDMNWLPVLGKITERGLRSSNVRLRDAVEAIKAAWKISDGAEKIIVENVDEAVALLAQLLVPGLEHTLVLDPDDLDWIAEMLEAKLAD